ncbi:Hypothetical protein, putative [Bodo saltans]|uniref:Uncharacterized protein n=1 Tax=Bodo saltans TaxID=75058 RepID=A0A0S4JHP7_BODSA|nr:Hypothetical protein, putative [Bodo saltans]|eukprot:CUG91024.1 Hypothetical protein, putative [Bodo saltans]
MTSDSFTLSTVVASLSRSAGSQSVLASMSMSNKSSTSLTTSLSLTTSKVATGGTLSLTHTLSSSSTWLGTLSRTATTLTLSSPSLSYMSPTLSCGTVEVKLMPFNSSLAASAFKFVDVAPSNADNEGALLAASRVVVAESIGRAELLQDPVVRMNISLMTQAFNTKRWDLANITMTGIGPLRFTIVNRSDDVVPMRWFVALVYSSTVSGDWVSDSVPLFADATFSMNLFFFCDAGSAQSLMIIFPSTGVARALEGGVETSAKSTQIISLFASVGAGSSLGRMLATRSLILCDADSAMNGGVLDVDLSICATASTGGVVAEHWRRSGT